MVVVLPVNLTAPETATRPATVRLRNINTTHFDVIVAVPAGTPAQHNGMWVPYMAAMRGSHTLPDGRLFEAGVVSTMQLQTGDLCSAKRDYPRGWTAFDFWTADGQSFSYAPAFVASLQTANNERPGFCLRCLVFPVQDIASI